jgi:dephospho-CoA kinase
MKVIGITGGIATGKSTVERILENLGTKVIDADKVVHKLLSDENVKNEIRQHFPDAFDNEGNIDRKKLASIVFNDYEKKKILENILHPKVNQEIDKWIEINKKENSDEVLFVSVPLMIETGSYKKYDKVVLVYAPRELQIKRLIENKGYSYEEALARINAQMDIEEKRKYADYIIENTGTIQELEEKVKQLYEILLKDGNCSK